MSPSRETRRATCVVVGAAEGAWREDLLGALPPCVAVLDVESASGLWEAGLAPGAGDVVVVLAPLRGPDGLVDGLLASVAPGVGTVSALPAGEVAVAAPPPDPGRLAPLIERAIGPCVLLARTALDLVGAPPSRDGEPGASVVEFSEMCGRRGLVNLLADAVPVTGPATVDARQELRQTPVAERALRRVASERLSVTIDGRSLNAGGAGTQVHTVELVGALANQARVRVVLPVDPSPWALEALERVPSVELRSYDDVLRDPAPTDVVHRPFQLFDLHDVALLRQLGRRLIVTHQDQLLYRNPAYFATRDDWSAYRRASRLALAWADRVVFFSEHARTEALRDEIVEREQSVVVPIGVERRISRGDGRARRPPADWKKLGGRPFLLVLGSDLAHKNRPFAIVLVDRLRRVHGWDGGLVLAGAQLEHGSLRDEEGRLLAATGIPAVELQSVSENERDWLLDTCSGVVAPSVDEGLGLVPFEAGAAGRPCFFAPAGPFLETFGADAAVLVPWDAARSAEGVASVLADEAGTAAHIETLRRAAAHLTWEAAAERLLNLYEEAASLPDRPVARLTEDAIEREARMAAVHAQYWELRDSLNEDALALVGPGGVLSPEMRRPFLAVAGRPWLRKPLFAALRLLYLAARRGTAS
jgi:glycosyltransferase involved in cell wall biosynthesis